MTPAPSAGITLGLSAAQREIWFAEQKLRRPIGSTTLGNTSTSLDQLIDAASLGPFWPAS